MLFSAAKRGGSGLGSADWRAGGVGGWRVVGSHQRFFDTFFLKVLMKEFEGCKPTRTMNQPKTTIEPHSNSLGSVT